MQLKLHCAHSCTTHFFFLKIQLNARHATEKAMPAVARTEKVAVRGIATVTSCSNGIPSCGMLPPGRQVRKEMSMNCHLVQSCTCAHSLTHLAINYLPFQEGRQTGTWDSLPKHYLLPPAEGPHLHDKLVN